jgi:hypothetical protein
MLHEAEKNFWHHKKAALGAAFLCFSSHKFEQLHDDIGRALHVL